MKLRASFMKASELWRYRTTPVIPGSWIQWLKVLLLATALVVFLSIMSTWTPTKSFGEDWQILRAGSLNLLHGKSPYADNSGYLNPPWFAPLLLPIAVFPFGISWGVLILASLVAVVLVWARWDDDHSVGKMLMAVVSPPFFYLTLLGQCDALILLAVLMAPSWWLFAVTLKPQLMVGLVAGTNLKAWRNFLPVLAVLVGLSFLLFGWWPAAVTQGGTDTQTLHGGHNQWRNLWPYHIPFGLYVVMIARRNQDVRWLAAASPLLSLYASFSNFLGLWLAVISNLSKRQAFLFWIVSWATVVFRAVSDL